MAYLRELAQKKLGPGHSKLRREELLQALAKFLPTEREKADKPSARRAPVVQSAMKKTPAGEGAKKSAPEAEPAKASRSKKVAIEDVAEEHEKKRSATLKKKVGADSLEAEAKKGARPVTARLSETRPVLSKGVARVKSAIANIAKEVEARRVAREVEAAPKAAAKANIQKEQVASRTVVSKEIEPSKSEQGLPAVKSAAPKRETKAEKSVATPRSEAKLSETPKPSAAAKTKPAAVEAAKPAAAKAKAETVEPAAAKAKAETVEPAAAKAKAETVEAAKPAAAKAKAETVEAAKPVPAKAKAETVEAAKPAAAKAKAETVEAAKPVPAKAKAETEKAAKPAAAKAKAEKVEAAKPAAAKAKPEMVEVAKPAAAKAEPGEAAKPAAAKAKAETVETAKPAAAKAEVVVAAKPAAVKAKPESVEAAQPATVAQVDVEAVAVPKPALAQTAEAGNVEAPKQAAAARSEAVSQPAAPPAREARTGSGAVITEAPWLQTAAKLQAERAETVKVATQNVESREVPRAALELKEVRSEPAASVAAVQAPTVESKTTPASPSGSKPAANMTAKVPAPASPPESKPVASAPAQATPPAFHPPRPASPQPGTLLARATLEETPAVVARQLIPSARNVAPSPTESVAPPAPRRRRRNGVPGAETVVEGFFVARIAGRQEAERHDLTDTHGGSPSAYSQGMSAPTFRRIVLLPRDPRTLFVFFDLATSGIELREGERVVVRIFDDGQAIRQLAAEQISRGFYVDGLQSLRSYYAEAWALGPQGERFLGPSSNTVSLPGVGAPAERVRFLKVPWTLPLPRLRDLARSGQVRLAERDGEVRVGMRHAVWHQEGPHAWDPSMSGQGRWMVVSEDDSDQYELIERDVEYPAGEPLRDGLPTSSGAGRPSSFTLVRPK